MDLFPLTPVFWTASAFPYRIYPKIDQFPVYRSFGQQVLFPIGFTPKLAQLTPTPWFWQLSCFPIDSTPKVDPFPLLIRRACLRIHQPRDLGQPWLGNFPYYWVRWTEEGLSGRKTWRPLPLLNFHLHYKEGRLGLGDVYFHHLAWDAHFAFSISQFFKKERLLTFPYPYKENLLKGQPSKEDHPEKGGILYPVKVGPQKHYHVDLSRASEDRGRRWSRNHRTIQ